MQAVLLVGGRGSRLGSLSKRSPKPLLQVGDRPFLDYVIDNLERFGVDEIVLLAGYRSDLVEEFAQTRMRGCGSGSARISVVSEAKPLGTGGALKHAGAKLAPSFLLVNGDCLFDIDYAELATPPTEQDWRVRFALRREADASRYGVVSLDDSGRIVEIEQRPKRSGPGLIIGGSYWMDRRILDAIPAGRCSLEKAVFPGLASRGLLYGTVYEGGFIDIGIPEAYVFAQTWVPAVFDLMRGEADPEREATERDGPGGASQDSERPEPEHLAQSTPLGK